MGCLTSRHCRRKGRKGVVGPEYGSVRTRDKSGTKMGSRDGPTRVTILHFNDVYNIEARETEPVGGAARMVTVVKEKKPLNPMVLFSGDIFNPSLMSALTKGEQMIPVMNALDIQCSVYGNHEFDFGVDTLVSLVQQTTFPWLMSNVIDNFTGRPLAEGELTYMLDWQGKKFGFVGLVEEEWLATLSTIDEDDVTFLDFVEEGRGLAQGLKEQGADYVIALTHMRWPNDIRLAENVEDIDLILGGHDHDYEIKQINGRYIIKSGTDFRNMSQITLTFDNNNKVEIGIEEVVIDSSVAEDPETRKVTEKYQAIMGEQLENVIGYMEVEMDGRFASIRANETNLGNFVTDIMLEASLADVALLNSGTLRSDTIHPKGSFKMKDLMSILPMVDPLVVLQASGDQIIEALENGVSQYPKLEGRFPQVSGLTFGFDPTLTPGCRVDQSSITIGGEHLDKNKLYRLVTKHYLSEGKDGYDVFKSCPILVSEEDGPRLSTAVQNHFESVHCIKGEKQMSFSHRQSLCSVSRRKSLQKQGSLCDDHEFDELKSSASMLCTSHNSLDQHSMHGDGGQQPDCHNSMSPSVTDCHKSRLGVTTPSRCGVTTPSHLRARHSITSQSQSRSKLMRRSSVECYELDHAKSSLAPEVEGRIFMITPQRRRELEDERLSRAVLNTTISEMEELID